VKLCIAIPCYEHISRNTAVSLGNLMFELGANPPPDFEGVGLKWTSSSNLPESRHRLVVVALDAGVSHILWVDSDMEFPKDGLARLAVHDLDIVGCNYPRRNAPHYSSASDPDYKAFDPGLTGLSKAGIIGFGFLLTKIGVFQRQDYPMPLFAHHDERGYVTEDVPFARKVIAAGYDLWVDHDLSREVRHVGVRSYGADDIEKMPAERIPTRR